ncbi:hypothetical protein [uncultured Winogradskyella sp.]|uniref:hypothetical protein n=1 Tax=uncultured Winogradskyella sp. TaxID=395353 RepID=UPI0026395DA0|nr:hypothetical protein [uncultured Winogradskyella sp.]
MKTFKTRFLILMTVLFAFNLANAQDEQPTMFAVHTDNVTFDMMPKYEELAKKLKENCEKYNIDINWTAISVEDGRYVYVTPIKNMAELDENPMGNLAEKMGKEAMGEMFNEMDDCYDSHSDSVIHLMPELSYIPEGYSTEGKNHREYHFLYYSPKNAKEMKEGMAKVKEMFKTKGVKNGYSVYHSGFGSEESYYMVSVAGSSDLSIAQGGEENDKLLGDDKDATFWNVIKLATKYDQVEADIRPDLSYSPSEEQ